MMTIFQLILWAKLWLLQFNWIESESSNIKKRELFPTKRSLDIYCFRNIFQKAATSLFPLFFFSKGQPFKLFSSFLDAWSDKNNLQFQTYMVTKPSAKLENKGNFWENMMSLEPFQIPTKIRSKFSNRNFWGLFFYLEKLACNIA